MTPINIYPLNDEQEHVLEGTSCPCCPEYKPADGGDLIVHSAFDGRDLVEQAEEILNLEENK